MSFYNLLRLTSTYLKKRYRQQQLGNNYLRLIFGPKMLRLRLYSLKKENSNFESITGEPVFGTGVRPFFLLRIEMFDEYLHSFLYQKNY